MSVKERNQLQQRSKLLELGFEKEQAKKEKADGIYQARKTAQGKGRCLKQNGMFRELPWNRSGYRVDLRERNNE